LPRSAPEKAVPAWWLRGCKSVLLGWLSQRLAMGHWTRVSQAVSQLKRRPGHRLERLQRRLLRLDRKMIVHVAHD
jgi:hypothetical protein